MPLAPGRAEALAAVREVVFRLFIGTPGTALRKEDEQKCLELAALLPKIAALRAGLHVVDAAAGKASVGLVAAELLALGRVTVIERDPSRVRACRRAAERASSGVPIDVREADVSDIAAWPSAPDVVVALHACGPATDAVIDAAAASDARHLLVVPCCYGASVATRRGALDLARSALGADDDRLGRKIADAVVDLERKLRLESLGYETHVEEFVAATVTPHNLLFRARRTRSPARMERSRARLDALRASLAG